MQKVSPKKLLQSKWTAAYPKNKEKHFVVTEVTYDDTGLVVFCVIQAVMNQHEQRIDWRDLNNRDQWKMGWV